MKCINAYQNLQFNITAVSDKNDGKICCILTIFPFSTFSLLNNVVKKDQNLHCSFDKFTTLNRWVEG